MRNSLFLLLLITFFSFTPIPPKTFSITIKQSGGIGSGESVTRITQDSIVVNGTNFHDNEDYGFENPLMPTQSKKIADALSKIDFDKLQSDYTNNNIDDALEFDFSITMDGKKKDFHIYVIRVPEILDLVKEINQVLPKDMQVGYDEAYLKLGK